MLLTGFLWIPSWAHVMTSKSSSSVPYPPDIHKEESNIRILSKPFKPNHILIHTHTHTHTHIYVLYVCIVCYNYVLYVCFVCMYESKCHTCRTREGNEGICLTGHLGFPLMHIWYSSHFSNSLTSYLFFFLIKKKNVPIISQYPLYY